MLKLTYSDLGLHLERVMTTLEFAIAQRVALAMRLGQPLCVESGRAAFLLPIDLVGDVDGVLQAEGTAATVTAVDDQFSEVALSGSWLAASHDADEGLFLAVMSDRAESLIYKLWQMSQQIPVVLQS
jgi:hypothetical protein